METKHKPATPLPWGARPDGIVVAPCPETQDAQPIAQAFHFGEYAGLPRNAAYIAHAANAYPKLVETLRKADVLLARLAGGTERKLHGGSECSIGHYASHHHAAVRNLLRELGELEQQ